MAKQKCQEMQSDTPSNSKPMQIMISNQKHKSQNYLINHKIEQSI